MDKKGAYPVYDLMYMVRLKSKFIEKLHRVSIKKIRKHPKYQNFFFQNIKYLKNDYLFLVETYLVIKIIFRQNFQI